jgi:hypothetical protein
VNPLSGPALVALALLAAVPWLPTTIRPRPRVGRRPRRVAAGGQPAQLHPAVVLDLAAVALTAGASVPGALTALGGVVGREGEPLTRAGSALVLGVPWAEAWEGAPPALVALQRALEPAWLDGVPAVPLLSRAADQLRAGDARAAQEAAARLGVRLVLPLGLCFLPAFVLLGLVPVLLSTGAGLLA